MQRILQIPNDNQQMLGRNNILYPQKIDDRVRQFTSFQRRYQVNDEGVQYQVISPKRHVSLKRNVEYDERHVEYDEKKCKLTQVENIRIKDLRKRHRTKSNTFRVQILTSNFPYSRNSGEEEGTVNCRP